MSCRRVLPADKPESGLKILTTKAEVAKHKVGKTGFEVVGIKVECTAQACKGTITLAISRAK